jgi:hypothetical protein
MGSGAPVAPPDDSSSGADYKSAYEQVCTSYHAIDDFRTKLLGFLPLATGAGIFLLVGKQGELTAAQPYLRGIAVFGFAVTLGLFVFEIFGIAKCARLIAIGRELEASMKIAPWGQFTRRPDAVLKLINEPFASGVIYPAVLAAWIYVALLFPDPQAVRTRAAGWAIGVFLVGFASVVGFDFALRRERPAGPEKPNAAAPPRH